MEQEYKAVEKYRIRKLDYDINELIDIADRMSLYENSIIDSFDDFDENVAWHGTRTTLKNELKVSDTEALNYLMGFPLSFDLKFFVMGLFNNIQSDVINQDETELISRLKVNFDIKKKLISHNFESTTHIDIQDFLAWAEIKNFIEIIPIDYSKLI